MASSNVSAIKGAHDAVNNRDWDAMSAIVANDCVWTDGRGQRYDGPKAFAHDYSKAWADAFSDGRVTDAQYYDAGDTVVAEFVGRGTNDGPLGPMPATGKHVELPYLEIYHFNAEGKVSSGRAYFDQLTLLAQLGHSQVPA
jgi:steroid delta-isomerase-like uncharacterized protein